MISIPIGVNGQKLKVPANLKNIVAGTQDFIKFEFGLDDHWSDLTVFAQFIQSDTAYNVYLDNEDSVYLPTEITDGTFTLALYGSSDTTIGTSTALTFTVEGSHYMDNATWVE